MKHRRESLEKEANRLSGLNLKVYEVREHENPRHWYYAIHRGNRQICTVCLPWSANKDKLIYIGRNLRYGNTDEELFELNNSEQKLIDADAKEQDDVTHEAINDAKTLLKIKSGSTISMAHRR